MVFWPKIITKFIVLTVESWFFCIKHNNIMRTTFSPSSNSLFTFNFICLRFANFLYKIKTSCCYSTLYMQFSKIEDQTIYVQFITFFLEYPKMFIRILLLFLLTEYFRFRKTFLASFVNWTFTLWMLFLLNLMLFV